MSKTPDIGELVYGRALHDIQWRLFEREAVLVFGEGESAVIVRLSGLHMLCFRQILCGPELQGFGKDCPVHLLQVQPDSEFLHAFLNKRLSFPSDVIVYDSTGNASQSSAFHKPQHVHVVCGRGDLDAICEEVSLCD